MEKIEEIEEIGEIEEIEEIGGKKALLEFESEDDLFKKIDNLNPGWIINILDCYSQDYGHLIRNWHKLCEDLKTTPKKILLVSDIDSEIDIDSLEAKLCNELTGHGYLVRRQKEFIQCHCGHAIPIKELYKQLKFMQMKADFEIIIPKKWSKTCTVCEKAD